MEDIDELINRLKAEQEIKDYIDNGIYPDRFRTNHSIIHMPKLQEIKTIDPDTSYVTPAFDFRVINDKIDKIELQIKNVVESEIVEYRDNDCPICMNDMGVNNYLVPVCGHKLCMNCFIKNIRQNKQQGHLCCLCRKNTIPDL
jgi:hypothetical protein|tara:strand:- start:1220 stop:1648 length:429 start_codon:yes stop_codon:yes gene_type:complete